MKRSSGLSCALAAVLGMLSVEAAESASMQLYCSSAHDLAWRTLSSRSVDLALTWPSGADRVLVSVKDAVTGGEVVSGAARPGESSWSWTVFSGDAPAADRCFSVSVTYYADEAEVCSETATLVLQRGTFAPVEVWSAAGGSGFARITSGRAIAYNSRWFASGTPPLRASVTERASGDETVFPLGSSENGYLLWNPRRQGGGVGWYDVVLSCGGDSMLAQALFGYEGTTVTVR